MTRTYSRFASAPIGPLLLASDGGLTLTTSADGANLQRTAVSTVAQTAGTHGAEFTFWGDADLQAVIGVVQSGASLSKMVGGDAAGIGWRLDTGRVYVGNSIVASGLPAVAKGDTVGVRLLLASGKVEFYKGDVLVHSRSIAAGHAWRFAASLAAPEAATLWAAVNAGQWQAAGPAGTAGWQPAAASLPTVRLSDIDWLSETHQRYEGVVDAEGLTTIAAIGFWPWGGDRGSQPGAAQLTVTDAGALDGLASADVAGVPVAIRLADLRGTAAGATDVARFVMDSIETLDDGRKALHLRDPHDDLDEIVNPGQFLPAVPALAWRTQPMVLGAVASVPYLGANSDGSVGWLSDSPLASVAAVLDRGDPMEAGTWSLASDGQQILLEQPPVGPVVADVSSIGAGQQPAALATALGELFDRIRKGAWSAADAAAIDSATGYAGIGYYAGDAVSARIALAAILPSYGAGMWQDATGVLRFARVVDPASVAPSFEIEAGQLAGDLVFWADEAPNLTRRMAYQPNARPLSAGELVTDLVDVPVWRRAELTAPYRGVAYSAKPLAARYAHADTAEPLVSVFWRAQDAQAEIDRVVGLYDRVRYFYELELRDPDLAPVPGSVGVLTYPRYGLDAGQRLLVRSIERNPVTGAVTLILWG